MKTPAPLFAFALAIFLTAVPAAVAAPGATPPRRPPNIVFILIDDMGWKDIAADGSKYYKTPNIDRLAAEGVRFTNAYAACAVCSPSRAAIMTGRSPARLHLTDWISGEGNRKDGRYRIPEWTKALPTDVPTLPELLKKQGYATASIGKWHLGPKDPTHFGFDVNIAGGDTGHPASYFWPYGDPKNSHRVPMLAEMGGKKGEYLTDRLTDEAIRFIDKNKGGPFFLYLPHYAVHDRIDAKTEDIAIFRDATPDGKQGSPVYAGAVKSVDDSVGRILAEIKRDGLEDNTIVIFTSDNGGVVHIDKRGNTDNAPMRAGKGFPYEGGIRVPLIVKVPGLTKPGAVSEAPVIGTDFLPTLAHLAGVTGKLPPILDGVDIAPALAGRKLDRDTLVWHYPHYWDGGVISPYSVIRSGDWKLVRWYEYASDELYDLAADISEKNDVAAKFPDKVAELGGKLDAALKEQGAQLPVLKKDAPPPPAPSTNKAHAKTFRVE